MTTRTADNGAPARDPAVRDAARRLLDKRLRRVEKAARQAADAAHDDPEAVHQLRVATRRAAAAIRLFRPWLADKPAKKAARTLRALRRRAGEARAADVLLERVLALHADTDDPRARDGWSLLAGALAARRERGLHEVHAALDDIDAKTLRKRRHALTDAVAKRPRDKTLAHIRSFAQLAHHTLDAQADDIARDAQRSADDLEALHQLRIDGKRLRYTIELARTVIGEDEADRRLAALEAMQDRLGDLNDLKDLRDAIAHVRDQLPADPPALHDALDLCEEEIDRRVTNTRDAFAVWWAEPGAELVLGSPAPDAPGAAPDDHAGDDAPDTSIDRDLERALSAADPAAR